MSHHTDIRPFRIDIPQADLDDLRERLARTRWPAQPGDSGWERGVPSGYLRRLVERWTHAYDWREHEARLNDLPQYVTTIDGQDVHFFHVGSPEPGAVPLLMTHGWPSSPVEFEKVMALLSDPRRHGGDPGDAFHLVIPALPGYGFSTPVAEVGWGNLFRVAQAWAELMDRLGYDRFAVHGTDVGSGVAMLMGVVAAERVIGVHVSGITPAMPFGPPLDVQGFTDAADRDRAERFNRFQQDGLGYLHLQATRPQTLGYLLNDSPVGQLAWIVEKFREWTDPHLELPEHAVDVDQLLTQVSLAWFTGAGASSAHATYEGMQAYRQMVDEAGHSPESPGDDRPAGPPMGYSVFAGDHTIRSLVDPTGDAYWSEHDRGGHFPAMEVPELLSADLRDFLRSLR